MSHLTDTICKRLPLPAKGNKVTYDGGKVPGFGICVTAKGARSFVLNYRVRGSGSSQERRITIGGFPSWSVSDARKKAKQLRREIDDGGDPLADIARERDAPTVADLIERFEEEHLPRLRPGSAKAYRFLLQNHIAPHFGPHMKVADVTYTACNDLHRKITAAKHPYAANRTKAVLTRMFRLAIQAGWRTDNPASAVEANHEQARKRYMSADELARLTAALAEYPNKKFADIVRLLLLTGARRGEVRSMRWADVDLGVGLWNKPASSTKQNADHTVPLSAPARQLLSELHAKRRQHSPWVFPSVRGDGHVIELQDDWVRLCKAAQITGLRTHDLRHSFASQLVSGGATLPLIGALLGHAKPSTTARYAHLYIDPQKAAVESIGAIISGKPVAEKVQLKRRRS